jgi:NADPH2:quinone reductase
LAVLQPERPPEAMMKAVLCRNFGPISDLRIEDVDAPEAGAGEVVIRVSACGVNFYDGLAAQGKYQTKPPFPFSPGGEVAGTIVSTGHGVESLRAGQSVMAFSGFGGYAERIAVDARFVFPLPDGMDFDEAAAFPIAYGTSYHALKDRARLQRGETLLVLGAAGGVGLTAVELGHEMGARVIAAASTPEKLALCRAHGAAATINYGRDDLRERVKALTEGRGVDIVYDPVGGKLAEAALRSLATFGRYLVIGFASGDIPQVALNQVLLKQTSVTGVLWGAFARAEPASNARNIAELLAWYKAGRIRPHVSEAYPLDRFGKALSRVMERKAQGKVVLRPQDGVAGPGIKVAEMAP